MMSQLFLRLFNWSSKTICFFLEAWGLFGIFLAWERPLGLSKAKKIPKRPKAERKKQIVWELKLKSLKKSWQIMKINLLSFYLRSHIVFTRICPWIQFFTLRASFCLFKHFILSLVRILLYLVTIFLKKDYFLLKKFISKTKKFQPIAIFF